MGKIILNYLDPVREFINLPVTGNVLGDVRLVECIGIQFYWSIVAASGAQSNWLQVSPDIGQAITVTTASDENKRRSWFGI